VDVFRQADMLRSGRFLSTSLPYGAYAELRRKYKFDPPFPSTMFNNCYSLNCLQDFEYYHGNGTTSKKNLDKYLGVKEGEPGGYYDQEGYTLSRR
jgi:hypothetical protein